MNRIAYIGTYVPQKCGIATYTHHLRQSVNGARGWKGQDEVYAVKPAFSLLGDTDPMIHEVEKEDRKAYRKLAERLNRSDVSVVSLQHEFGIFGGEAGENVLDLVDHLDKPLAVTFHTVFEHPEEPYLSIQKRIAQRSDLILVMNRLAAGFLHRSMGVPMDKIRCVPHGTPEPAAGLRERTRQSMSWDGRKVMMSFGLLSRGKGFELILRALPDVVRKVPNALYAIVGQTHPEVRKWEGEAYRQELESLARELGVDGHVVMIDRFVEENELAGLLSAADLYVTPYPGMQQITSGTLAYAVGLGRPVLTTPYAYAKDLLGDYPELLIPFDDTQGWSEQMGAILSDEETAKRWEREMGRIGADMHWSKVGQLHLELFNGLAASVPEIMKAN